MAKRSIEIAISASNQTAGGLSGAKAELQRWGDDVKRIQANVAAAARAGDMPAAMGQQRLLGGAQERRATAQQAAEGQADLQQRLKAFKAQRAEIDKSAAGTRQVADNSRRIAEHAHKGADGFEKQARAAISFGKVMIAARVATQAMRIATAAMEGDWNAIGEAIKGIPMYGPGIEAGYGLGRAIGKKLVGPTKAQEAKEAIAIQRVEAGLAAIDSLAAITAKAEFQASLAGMTQRDREISLRGQKLERDLARVDELAGLAQDMTSPDKDAGEATRSAIWKAGLAEEGRITRQRNAQEDAERLADATAEYHETLRLADQQGDIEQAAYERRKDLEADTAGEIARLRIETTEKGLAREMALLDLRRQKELANTELTEELKAAIREKYGLLELQARQGQPAAADAAARRRPEAPGIPAIERGFLTRVPGRQWEVEGLAAQKKIAANTKATADATKDLVKAYESIDKMTGQVRSYAPTIAHF